MTKYVACWDYDDCASILFDLFYKESQSYKELHKFIADHRPHNIDSKKLIDAAHADMLALFNNSATEEPLTELSTCSLRANKYIDQMNLDAKSPKGYTADQRLLSNDLQMAEKLDCFTVTLSMLTMADVANAILADSPLKGLQARALMEGTQCAFKFIEKSKFSMFVLISQYYKMRWPDEDIVIDVYDDQLASSLSHIARGVGRLSRETGWIPKRVQMRFHAMDSYTLLYKERDGDEIAFVNSLKHFSSLENFKPFTSHHKLVKSINGTGKLLQREALKKIAHQCFKQPTLPVDLIGVSLDNMDDFKPDNSSGLADAAPKSPADAASKSPVDVCCITQPIHCFGIAKAATVPPQDKGGDISLSAVGNFKSDHTSGASPESIFSSSISATKVCTEYGFFREVKRRKTIEAEPQDNPFSTKTQLPK